MPTSIYFKGRWKSGRSEGDFLQRLVRQLLFSFYRVSSYKRRVIANRLGLVISWWISGEKQGICCPYVHIWRVTSGSVCRLEGTCEKGLHLCDGTGFGGARHFLTATLCTGRRLQCGFAWWHRGRRQYIHVQYRTCIVGYELSGYEAAFLLLYMNILCCRLFNVRATYVWQYGSTELIVVDCKGVESQGEPFFSTVL